MLTQKIKTKKVLKDKIETGPLQINEDWPGFFIRGDNCAYFTYAIQTVLDNIRDNINSPATLLSVVQSYINLMNDVQLCNQNKSKK